MSVEAHTFDIIVHPMLRPMRRKSISHLGEQIGFTALLGNLIAEARRR